MPRSIEEILASAQQQPDQPEPGMFESALRGGAQGASFGFADELTGGGQAILESILGQHPEQDFTEKYTRGRDESRAAYKAAEEANPTTSLVSGLAGGLAPALLTAGGTLPESIGAVALQGAKYGTVAGLGSSEADLTGGDVIGAGKDVLAGGVLGAGLGATIHAGAGVLDKLLPELQAAGKAIKEIGPIKKTLGAYKHGTQGTNLITTSSNKAFLEKAEPFINNIKTEIASMANKYGKTIGDKEGQNEVLIEIAPQIENLRSKIIELKNRFNFSDEHDVELNKLNSLLDRFSNGVKETVYKDVTTTTTAPEAAAFEANLQKLKAKRELEKQLAGAREAPTFEHVVTPTIGEPIPGSEYTEAVVQGGKQTGARTFSPSLTNEEGMLTNPPKLENVYKAKESMQQELDKQLATSGELTTKEIEYLGKKYVGIVDPITGKLASPRIYEMTPTNELKVTETNVPTEIFTGGKINPEGQATVQSLADLKKTSGNMLPKKNPITGEVISGELNTPEAVGINKNLFDTLKYELNKAIPGMIDDNAIYSALKGAQKYSPEVSAALKSQDYKISSMKSFGDTSNFLKMLSGDGIDLRLMPTTLKQKLPSIVQDRIAKGGVRELSAGEMTQITPEILAEVKTYESGLKSASSALKQKFSEVGPNLSKLSEEASIRQQIQAPGLGGHGSNPISWAASSASGLQYATANIAGLGQKFAGQAIKNAAKAVYDSTPEMVKQFSNMAKQGGTKAGQALSYVLDQVAESDGAKRRALMFGVMQNPEYRKMLEDMTGQPALPKD